MDDTGQNQANIGSPDAEPMKNPPGDLRYAAERPMVVWEFGIMNIILGCYSLVHMVYGLLNFIYGFDKITETGILDFLVIVIGFGLSIWLILLGFGLLAMKRWARRGSVLYGWLQVTLMVIFFSAMFIGLRHAPWIFLAYIIRDSALSVIYWLYMILLLIFMKTEKVKRAFGAVGG